jgi:UDP-N-acetylglucosamine 2-epimerase (non-hydrolysing)
VTRLLTDRTAYEAMAAARNPYGDGRATERILAACRRFFGHGGEPIQEFDPRN